MAALLEKWGRAGFEAHIKDIQAQYARRASIVHAAAKKHLAGLATWAEPRAGMFLWVRLCGFEDAAQILSQLREARVIVVPGAGLRTLTFAFRLMCPCPAEDEQCLAPKQGHGQLKDQMTDHLTCRSFLLAHGSQRRQAVPLPAHLIRGFH